MSGPEPQLFVEFCGEEHHVDPTDTLTFGRIGQLVIDENPFLHRRLGLFEAVGDVWWLHNVGSTIVIELADRNSPSRMMVAPGSSVALGFEEALLRFQAGKTTYEVIVEAPPLGAPPVLEVGDEPATITAASTSLTPDQRRCIVALAEQRLIEPGAAATTLPTNRQASARLGWKVTRFNRKLDNVCGKLSAAGVAGLHGSSDGLATKRRELLVEYALATGMVTVDDVALLDQTP